MRLPARGRRENPFSGVIGKLEPIFDDAADTAIGDGIAEIGRGVERSRRRWWSGSGGARCRRRCSMGAFWIGDDDDEKDCFRSQLDWNMISTMFLLVASGPNSDTVVM
ncbi:hypothetical protein LOK49_LG08G01664 [Camellia lanceoleosa]|uniref:Uncharacterized protein n=1 Tax=Camellia lanceoleosa TaxID=1840588 RepID=A0ACC0GQ09_9ERIC|nr:hypothetical protein LOK49_LG08G01664 [Camellia lanceoleosa]